MSCDINQDDMNSEKDRLICDILYFCGPRLISEIANITKLGRRYLRHRLQYLTKHGVTLEIAKKHYRLDRLVDGPVPHLPPEQSMESFMRGFKEVYLRIGNFILNINMPIEMYQDYFYGTQPYTQDVKGYIPRIYPSHAQNIIYKILNHKKCQRSIKKNEKFTYTLTYQDELWKTLPPQGRRIIRFDDPSILFNIP